MVSFGWMKYGVDSYFRKKEGCFGGMVFDGRSSDGKCFISDVSIGTRAPLRTA